MTDNNAGKDWTENDIAELKKLAKQKTDTDTIAKKLGRSKSAVYTKASDHNITLMPKDK
ncbi:MAG: hypothetical protein ABUK01_07770 [Leptospirales bacterium]